MRNFNLLLAGSTVLAAMALLAGCPQPTDGDLDPGAEDVLAVDTEGNWVRILFDNYTGQDPFSAQPMEPTELEKEEEKETAGRGTYSSASGGSLEATNDESNDGNGWGWYECTETCTFSIEYTISDGGDTLTAAGATYSRIDP